MLMISLIEINAHNVKKIKEIHILEICKELIPSDCWLNDITPEDFIDCVDCNFAINNNKDVMI